MTTTIKIANRRKLMDKTIRLMRKKRENFHMNWLCKLGFTSTVLQAKEAINECGTSACIAGFICATDETLSTWEVCEQKAREMLDLDNDLGHALFGAGLGYCSEFDLNSPRGHTLGNIDVNVGIEALRLAVKIQNKRDRKNAKSSA